MPILISTEPLRTSRQFRTLWLGYAVSQVGSQLTTVGVAYQVYLLTGSSFDVGLISLVQLLPAIASALGSGAVADAVDRRVMLLVTQTALALSSLGLALNAGLRAPHLSLVFLFAAVTATFDSADSSTRTALMMSAVPRSSIVQANALRQLLQQGAQVMGPAVAGVLLAEVGVPWLYRVDVASFGASLLAVALVGAVPRTGTLRKPGLSSILEGLRFARRSGPILGGFAADLSATVFGMPTALFPAIALDRLHGGPHAVGLLYAAPACGALIAALTTGWVHSVQRAGRAVTIAVVAWGLAITGFGFSRVLVVSVVLLALAGAADMVSAVFRGAILQSEAPDEMRGRLSSIHTVVVQSGPRLGNAEAGFVAALTSPFASVVSGGLASVAAMLIIRSRLPAFRHYRLEVDGAGPTTQA